MTVLDGGELLARTLRQAGVEEIFALHGGHLESFYQGCVNNHIRLTDTRHEAAAATRRTAMRGPQGGWGSVSSPRGRASPMRSRRSSTPISTPRRPCS